MATTKVHWRVENPIGTLPTTGLETGEHICNQVPIYAPPPRALL